MVNDSTNLNKWLLIIENERFEELNLKYTIKIINHYFKNFFYIINTDLLDKKIKQSINYYNKSDITDNDLETKLLLFQAAIKQDKRDYVHITKNLKRCEEIGYLSNSKIYQVHFYLRTGLLNIGKQMRKEALVEFKKAKSILDETREGLLNNTELYLEVCSCIYLGYTFSGQHKHAFKYYYETVELGMKFELYDAIAKLNLNFYQLCYNARAYEEADEAIDLTRKISKLTNSTYVQIQLAAIEILEKYFKNKTDELEHLLIKHKKKLLSTNHIFFMCFYLYFTIDVKLKQKKYASAFKHCTQLCRHIKHPKHQYHYHLLYFLTKICLSKIKYLALISEIPEYQKYSINNNIDNLFKLCIENVANRSKNTQINLYTLIIEYYGKFGFKTTGLDVFSACINELHKISSESVEKEMLYFKQKFRSTKKMKAKNELLDKQKKLTQFFKEFAYSAAHDLKAPLKTIAGFAKIIKKSYNIMPIETSQTYLNSILETSETMSKFINELIIYKEDSREIKVRKKVDLSKVIEQVKTNLYKEIEKSNCKIEILYNEATFVVRRTPLEILFQNFISNAIKYRRKGIEPVVKIDLKRNGNDVILVSDNGRGIEKNMHEKIFEPFFQIPDKKTVGSGIGLATCKRIVESWGGKIWLESTLGKGTTFYFSI